jgi:hypothetical protein
MKLVAFLSAVLVASSAMAGELVSHSGDDTIRLVDDQCTSQLVLDQLQPESRPQFRAASVFLQGQAFAACWRATPTGALLIYEDGDQGMVPFDVLKPLTSV